MRCACAVHIDTLQEIVLHHAISVLTGPLGSIDVGRVYGKMPPKQVAKSQEDDRAPENVAAWHESKRLQELAYKGVGLLPLQLNLHGPRHTVYTRV